MKLWPLYRVTIVFKGGGSMTADVRGFTVSSKEVKWHNLATDRPSIIKCDPDEVCGAIYSRIGYSLKAPDKAFQ